jgi:aerobic carbon-monoxide dehydrogenase large subunit
MLQGTVSRADSSEEKTDLHYMKRLEDFRFLTGRSAFADDIKPENIAFLGIVRSPYAHAKIVRIDFSKVSGHPAFIEAITGEDLAKLGVGIIFEADMPNVKRTGRRHLALEKVRYVGEPVAAFLSKDRYSVEDIAEDIEVEYETLPSVSTIEESKVGKAILYEEMGNNVLLETRVKKGDADHEIRSAPHVVKARYGVKRQSGAAIEPRIVIAHFDKESGIYNVISTTQSTHRLKTYLSSELKIPPEKFHINVPDVGGSFGGKGAQSYCAVAVACILSQKTGLSVKWVSTRTEDLLETAQSRDLYCEIELACDSNAKIVALRADIVADGGVGGTLKAQAILSGKLIPGPYKIPNLEIKSTSYATNKTPSGPIRGAGRPEGLYFIEMIVDKMARHLCLDPIGFRRLNAIPKREFPYDNGAGFIYDSADFNKLLDSIKPSYEEMLEWRRGISKQNSTLLAGVSVALVVEDTGSQFSETAKIVPLIKEQRFVVYTGSSPHGQGIETTFTILAAEELGLPISKIEIRWGDSNYLPTSVGTFGSRSIVTGGSAVVDVCRKLKETIISAASSHFAIPREELVLRGEMLLRKTPVREAELISDIWSLIEKTGKEFEVLATFTSKGQTSLAPPMFVP